MANSRHLKIVRRGKEAIEHWLTQQPGGEAFRGLDLRDANLKGIDLSGADLQGADLRRANLSGADLSSTYLDETNLTGAKLTDVSLLESRLWGTCLRSADLSGADLALAHLLGANVRKARFRKANFDGARIQALSLADADLTGAFCNGTVFTDVDLLGTVGLDSIVHGTPSEVSLSTLASSKGRIPATFLRGCGLVEWEIAAQKLYNPHISRSRIRVVQHKILALRSGSNSSLSVFVSYSRFDSPFVDVLGRALSKSGIRVWRDVQDATAGRLDKIIDHAMREQSAILMVLSKNSVESDWVEDEALRARNLELQLGRDVLCPIALDDAWLGCGWSHKLQTQIQKYNVVKFQNWHSRAAFKKAFARLVDGLSTLYQS